MDPADPVIHERRDGGIETRIGDRERDSPLSGRKRRLRCRHREEVVDGPAHRQREMMRIERRRIGIAAAHRVVDAGTDEFHRAMAVDDGVFGFECAVDELLAVRHREGVAQVGPLEEYLVRFHARACANEVRKRAAEHELARDVGTAIEVPDTEHRSDVGMLEPERGGGGGNEALVVGTQRRQCDRHEATGLGIPRAIGRPTASEPVGHLMTTDVRRSVSHTRLSSGPVGVRTSNA